MIAAVARALTAAARWVSTDHTDTFHHPLDLTESRRSRLIREAEFQQRADAESRVLRSTAQRRPAGYYPLRRIRAR